MRKFIVVLLVMPFAANANLILNGDFEDHTATSRASNLSNSEFNALMSNATAFGEANEIDLQSGGQSGDWSLSLHTQATEFGGSFDAFSLNLSSGVIASNLYQLVFYAWDFSFGGDFNFQIEIGLSNTATSFGSLLYSASTSATDVWQEFNLNFVAPSDALFLTVRANPTAHLESGGNFGIVDNFSLTPVSVPEPGTLALFGIGLAAMRLTRRRNN